MNQQITGYANPDGSGRGNWSEPIHDLTCPSSCPHWQGFWDPGAIERRPDGTLIRQQANPFSAEALSRRLGGRTSGVIEPSGDGFCPSCGYRQDLHADTCPSETEARAAYGER